MGKKSLFVFCFLLCCGYINIYAQQKVTISGSVVNESGQALIGATVVEVSTTNTTVTDQQGHFNLLVSSGNAALEISYTGYTTAAVPVNNQSVINVVLKGITSKLDEVVVVGYGTQKKVNLTGAVDVISSEQIENRSSSTVSQILQGQSPALTFSLGNSGFEPGASMGIDIRGIGSLNGGSPLILIDGFPGSMDQLNPQDIESISVLKDAAASAIYGARAPYGVILITTKDGKRNEKPAFSYSGNVSISKPDRLPKPLDSYTFARVVNEMGDNGGGRPYPQANIDRILAYQRGDIDYLRQFSPPDATYFEVTPRPEDPNRWGHNQMGYANYNWYDEYYGYGVSQNHNFSITGGSNKSTYYISSGYEGEDGSLNYGTDYYKRLNLTGKINTKVTDWWDLGYTTRFVKTTREFFNGKTGGGYEGLFREMVRTIPTQSKYDGYGRYSMESKIPWIQQAGTDKYINTENWHILNTEIRPAKGWKINGDFAYNSIGYRRTNVKKAVIETYIDGTTKEFGETLPSGITHIQQNNSYLSTNIYTSYDLRIKSAHNIFAMVGTQYEINESSVLTASKINLIDPDVPSLQTANGDPIVSESLAHWATKGYFGRLTYNYNEKYLFEANVRYDGTSRFKEGARWGFFPSFSTGWNISKEKFWQSVQKYINTLKFRASWGQLGNQQISPYLDLSLMPLQTNQLNWIFKYGDNRPTGFTGTPQIVSPNLTWETATTKNFGINSSFLNSRLHLDFDLFERTTTNMIGPSEPVPGVLGSATPSSNNATLRTNGWELSLGWNHVLKGNKFSSYFLRLNLQDGKTIVTKYLNPSGLISSWYAGKTVGEIWGYTVNKLFGSQEEVDSYTAKVDLSNIYSSWNPGDVRYEDINGDGKVNQGNNSLSSHGDLSIIGNSTPRYQFGISGGLSIKQFDFSFLLQGTAKRQYSVPKSGEQYVFWGVQSWLFVALTRAHLDYFRDQPGTESAGLYEGTANINTDAYWPRPYLNRAMNDKNREPSTRYLLDASYVRLANLQLGYSLTQSILRRVGFKGFRVYVSAENLFTITHLQRGIDPIALDSRSRIGMTNGADKMFTIGLNINF